MQVADRFHLYENLHEAVKKALNFIIPSAVPTEPAEEPSSVERDKKRGSESGRNGKVFHSINSGGERQVPADHAGA